jgi:3-methylfumaryl-CoA hydratase
VSGVLARSLAGWQPGTTELTRVVDPWPGAAFTALTEVPLPPPRAGEPLPPMWHWFTLLDHPAQSATGADGHPASGPFLPPIPGRRRMFAGGRLTLDAPVLVGAELTSRSAVTAVSVKEGRSGELAFVTVRHELSSGGRPVGAEEQDIVYRSEPPGEGPAGSGPRPVPRPEGGHPEPAGPWRRELATGPVQLFRFSALTYNAHRIHYDRPYATGTEGYPDLVIHGPLLALLALELPRLHAPGRPVRSFRYRLVQPAFVPATVVAAGQPGPASATGDGDTVEVSVAAAGAAPSLTGQVVLG